MSALTPEGQQRLMDSARQAFSRAWAPYSKFRVGAAVLTESGRIFTGCNVENASYGLTNCAERTAIFSAVAELGGENLALRAVAVAAEQPVACAPCGACRQVIYEFGPEAIVFFSTAHGVREMHIRDLLPEGFRLS